MNQQSEAYRLEKERLRGVFSGILGNEEAANWVIERRIDKVEELKQRFSDKKVALVSFDVDKIKHFVFGTTKPLEIQGASAMVKDLDRNGRITQDILHARKLDDSNVLFAGGGTGLLIVPATEASAVSREIENLFAAETGIGSCTVVHQTFAPDELIKGPHISPMADQALPSGVKFITADDAEQIPFGRIMQLLADQLREAKEEKVRFYPPLPGFIHRCESCGVEVASRWDRLRPAEAQDRICSHCWQKRKRGRTERDGIEETLKTAISINDIAGEEEERGYFSVLYADANNMGKILFQLESIADYALFSNTVTKVLEEATEELIQEHQLVNRYQAPVLGGDDIFFIVPSSKVAKLAPCLMETVKARFEKEACAIGGSVAKHLSSIGMSIGFVIVPAHFAIRFAVDYAEALLRSAKRERREKKEDCIDYLVLKDASPLNIAIDDLRDSQFRREEKGWRLDLTRKPVTVSVFKEMLKTVRLLREAGVPQSQLHQVEMLLQQESPQVASLNICYQLIRVKAWREFCHKVGIPDINRQILLKTHTLSKTGVLHKPNPNVENYESGFLDLMELYEFREVE